MTTLENANDGIPDDAPAPQEKLEWVTPKISALGNNRNRRRQINFHYITARLSCWSLLTQCATNPAHTNKTH